MTIKIARLALILPFAALAACETTTSDPTPAAPPRTPVQTVSSGDAAATAAAADAAAGTAASSAAAAPVSGRLGTTVASLGDATEGGMWLKTPLVRSAAKGRVVNPATGKSVNVNLIPLGGAASGGSQMSLPAMTSLGIGLTDLPTVEVFAA